MRRDDDDATDGASFVRELPGAASGLEEAVVAAVRATSLGDACARAGVTTMTTTTRGGEIVIDENAVAAVTEEALDAAMRAKAAAAEDLATRAARRGRNEAEESARTAFQRAVFAKKLHDRVMTAVRVEVRRRAESDLRMARRRAMETAAGPDAEKALDRKREAPHKPWFLLETPTEEQSRLRRVAQLEAAAAEAGDETAEPMWVMPEFMKVEPVPDPTDESIEGTVKHCFYMVQSHPRPIQKVLDYIFGYSPAVDCCDLEEIASYAKGLAVPRGKTPKELACAYAANLDKILGERDKVALKKLIKDVRDEWATHIKAGGDAVRELEATPLDSAKDISTQNRDSWLRAMFPTLDWPDRNEKQFAFMQGLRGTNEAFRAVSTSRPVPLAQARASLARAGKSFKAEPHKLEQGNIRYTADAVPIVAPEGFYPSLAVERARKAETQRARAAAVYAEEQLKDRQRNRNMEPK